MRFFPDGSEGSDPSGGDPGTDPAAGSDTNPQEKTEVPEGFVPQARLTEAMDKAKAAEEKAEIAMSQLRLQNANQPQQPEAKPQEHFVKAIIKRHFTDDDDVAGRDQLEACLRDLSDYFGSVISNMQVMQTSPNYNQVVGKYFPNVVKNDPAMARAFNMLQSQNPALASQFAYKICTLSPEYIKDNTKKEEAEEPPEKKAADAAAKAAVDAAIKASQQPGSASSVGGAGAMDLTAQVNELSKDPDKFDKWTEDVIAGRIKF